jgi:hypothetical protein
MSDIIDLQWVRFERDVLRRLEAYERLGQCARHYGNLAGMVGAVALMEALQVETNARAAA